MVILMMMIMMMFNYDNDDGDDDEGYDNDYGTDEMSMYYAQPLYSCTTSTHCGHIWILKTEVGFTPKCGTIMQSVYTIANSCTALRNCSQRFDVYKSAEYSFLMRS